VFGGEGEARCIIWWETGAEAQVGRRDDASTGTARREMYVQIKAFGSGDGAGDTRTTRLDEQLRECAPTPKRLSWCIAKGVEGNGKDRCKDWLG
jgi:hypothetical protein